MLKRADSVKFFQGVFLLSGTIIGVGMFGIPFVFSRSGIIIGFLELILFAGVILSIHLMYGEVILRTPGVHQLPGYVGIYLGKKAKTLSLASFIIGVSGSLLAYVVLGGAFLGSLLGVSAFSGQMLFWALGSVFIFFSIRQSGFLDGVLNVILIAVLSVFVAVGFSFGDTARLPFFDITNIFLPYGVLLFALIGSQAIPEVRVVLGQSKVSYLKPIIIVGTLIPAALYALFAYSVISISKDATSPDVFSGLLGIVPPFLITVGEVVGVLATFTTFLVLGLALKDMYHFDLRVDRTLAWILTTMVPLSLLFAGVTGFIMIISFVGAVAGGIDATLTVLAHQVAQKRSLQTPAYVFRIVQTARVVLPIFFILGIFWELSHFWTVG